MIWRPGNANTAAGATEWIAVLVQRLRDAGVEEITVRLDKGFFSKAIVETLEALDVGFLLKIPNHNWLTDHQRPWRRSKRGEGIFEGTLGLDTYEVTDTAHVLTNLPGIHALTAWRRYNQGAVVEQRIRELGQLACGRTAVDDL